MTAIKKKRKDVRAMEFLASVFGTNRKEIPEQPETGLLAALTASKSVEPHLAKTIADDVSDGDNVFFADMAAGMHDVAKAFKTAREYLDGVKLNSLTLDGIPRPEGLPLLEGMTLNTDKLTILQSDLSGQDWKTVRENADKGNIKSLFLKDNDIETLRAFFDSKEPCKLDSLTIRKCGLIDEDFTRLAEGVIAKSSLKRLDLNQNFVNGDGLCDVIKALPDTLEEFSIKYAWLRKNAKAVQVLADKVETMPNLKVLDLSSSGISTNELKILMPKLPPSLRTINLEDSDAIDDEGMRIVLDALRRPDCRITSTNAKNLRKKTGDAASQQLELDVRQAEADNAIASMADQQRLKADQIAKAKGGKTLEERLSEADIGTIKSMLHTAVQTGLLPLAFDRLSALGGTLTERDLKSGNDKGETFVQACFKMRQTKTLMRPEVYGNAKDYQSAYDSLPETEKKMFDGRDGRPSFLKMKNQVMAAAVKKALAGKSATANRA